MPKPGMACGNGATFPTFNKACVDATTCVFALHQLDCCGSQEAIGFDHGQRDAFATAEATWDTTCAACQCAAQPLKAEDGTTCSMARLTVACTGGMCTTKCM
jgi:hypothetical protein